MPVLFTRKGFYTVFTPVGVKLSQHTTRDECYEAILTDAQLGIYVIMCPNREVTLVAPGTAPAPTPAPVPDPAPNPVPNPGASSYRGIPDPGFMLGFDAFADYTPNEFIADVNGTLQLTQSGTPGNPYVYDLQGAVMNVLAVLGSDVVVQNYVIANDSESALATNGNRILLKDGNVGGPSTNQGNGTAVWTQNPGVVYLRTVVHDFGVLVAATENDLHGWKIQTEDVYLIDCETYNMAGDGVQVGDASRGRGDRIYIGGGHYHDNRENAIDVKDSSEVVVSGVKMNGFRPTPSSPGEAVIIHNNAVGTRILDCDISDTVLGIVSSGLRDHEIDGNIIVASAEGLQLRNTQNLTVQNNEITAPLRINIQGGVTGNIQS